MTLPAKRCFYLLHLLAVTANAWLGESARAQVNYPDFTNPTNLVTFGTASVDASGLHLTAAAAGQNGTAHFGTRLSLMAGFETTFTFRISGIGGVADEQGEPGGDGLAFIIHKQSPSSANPTVGYIPYSLQDCVAVEFDTWDNSNLADPNGNHVSIQSVGPAPDGVSEFHHDHSLGWGTPGVNLSDGAIHTARIRYQAQLMTVYVDNMVTPVVSVSLNLTNLSGRSALDTNALATVGLVAGTGAAYESHEILGWTLETVKAPVITNQPQGTSARLCGSASFSVGAKGDGPLGYQWRREGVELPGQTAATLTLDNVQFGDGGNYAVIVSNPAGATISSDAYLSVDSSTDGSDSFSNATPLCVEFSSFGASGFNFSATTEPGEPPTHTANSVWWKVVQPFTGTYILDTAGSTFDSAMAVYTGSSLATLNQVGLSGGRFPPPANDDRSAFLKIPLSGAETYWIAVYSENGSVGQIQLFGTMERRPNSALYLFDLPPDNVLTNGEALRPYYVAGGPYEFLSVQVFDNNRRIHSAQYQQIGNVLGAFDWSLVPLGSHNLRLEVQNPNVANGNVAVDGPSFTVVGRDVGFSEVRDLHKTPVLDGELLDFNLVITNRVPTVTGPMRVRLIEAATALLRAHDEATNLPPLLDQIITDFPPVTTPGLAPGGGWLVAATNYIVCKAFARDDQIPNQSGNGSEGIQYHVDALLEEQRDGIWIALDRTRICSSEPNALSPPNEGATGQDGKVNTNQVTIILAPLLLQGPATINENSSASLEAWVRVSNNTTNVVMPAWSVNPPFSIDATGRLTTPTLAANSNALVTAIYARSIQTLTATRSIAVLKIVASEVLQLESPQVVAGRFKVTIKGAANKTYEILSGTNVLSLSLLQSVTTDAQGQALLDVPVANPAGGRFFKAQRTVP